ncbi:MAG: N-acyl-D-amino-acid deacylase family protein [Candidatus Binatia bacterium]
MQYDLLIKDSFLVNGSGLPGYHGDVGVANGKIVAMGKVDGPAREVIDARGLVVAPGFIDVHTHYDAQLFWDPWATPSCWHGFTSVFMTNCGFGLAPCKAQDREYITRMLVKVEAMPLESLKAGVPWNWESYGEYLDALDRRLGVNVMALAPHSTIRYHVMGEEARKRPATTEEIDTMQSVVADCMKAGAFGFSSSYGPVHFDGDGLPVPSRFAAQDEVVALARTLKDFHRGTVCVIPPGIPKVGAADMDYLARLSRESGRPVVWNLLSQTWDAPDHWRQVLDWTAEAFRDGARVHPLALCERFDLTFSLRGAVFEDLPAWKAAIKGSRAQKIANLSHPEMRAAMQRDLDDPTPKVFSKRMQDVFVSAVCRDEHQSLVGKTLVEVGKEQGKTPLEAMLDLAIDENLDTQFLIRGFQNGDEEAVRGLTTNPYVLTGGSDGGAHIAFLCQVTYSTFLLSHWVREKKALTLEQAVRKLSFDPAVLLGIPNRGLLKEGLVADLTIFDPEKVQAKEREFVRDLPGGASRLIARADGYRYTVVNGQVLLRDGEPTGACPGRVLRSYERP